MNERPCTKNGAEGMISQAPQVGALHRAALAYAARGLRVFPLALGEKIPVKGGHGHHEASCDPLVIARIWTANPNCNIGIRPAPRFLVVDFDDPSALERAADEYGIRPEETLRVHTRRGVHAWYLHPDIEEEIGNVEAFGAGTDVRASGGYVVAPPSIVSPDVAKGQVGDFQYRWATDGARAATALPARAVQRLRECLRPIPALPAAPRVVSGDELAHRIECYIAAIPSGQGEGSRNKMLFYVAAKLTRDFALSVADAEPWLRVVNQGFATPLSEHEFGSVLKSARKNGKYPIGSALVERLRARVIRAPATPFAQAEPASGEWSLAR